MNYYVYITNLDVIVLYGSNVLTYKHFVLQFV
jgi:hypothetical protein